MDKQLLEYNSEIDAKVSFTVAETLATKVLSSVRIKKGEVNYVYLVETPKEKFVVRVFRIPDYPETKDLEWVNEQLTKSGIPHSKILKIDRESEFFPNGFMISEYLEGENCEDAVHAGKFTFEEYCKQAGAILDQIHAITLKKFGNINNGDGEYDNYVETSLQEAEKSIAEVIDVISLDKDLVPKIYASIKTLEKYSNRLKPVLVHGDPNMDNAILTPERKVILVDWDNTKGDTALEDFATLTYWRMNHHGQVLEEYKDALQVAYFNGYGEIDFAPTEVKEIVRVLQIMKSVKLLPYYLNIQKRQNSIDDTKEKLANLLAGL